MSSWSEARDCVNRTGRCRRERSTPLAKDFFLSGAGTRCHRRARPAQVASAKGVRTNHTRHRRSSLFTLHRVATRWPRSQLRLTATRTRCVWRSPRSIGSNAIQATKSSNRRGSPSSHPISEFQDSWRRLCARALLADVVRRIRIVSLATPADYAGVWVAFITISSTHHEREFCI